MQKCEGKSLIQSDHALLQKRTLNEVIVYPSDILLFHCSLYHISAQLSIHVKNTPMKRYTSNFSKGSSGQNSSRYFYELKTTNKRAFKVSQSKGILDKAAHNITIYLTLNKSLHQMLKEQFKLYVYDLNKDHQEPAIWRFKIAIQDTKTANSAQKNCKDEFNLSQVNQSVKNILPSTILSNLSNISGFAKSQLTLKKTLSRKYRVSVTGQKQNIENLKDQVKQGFLDSKMVVNQYKLARLRQQKVIEPQNFESKFLKVKKFIEKQSAKERYIHSIKELNLKKSELERSIQAKKNNETKIRFKMYSALLIFIICFFLGITFKNFQNKYLSEGLKIFETKQSNEKYGIFFFSKQTQQKQNWF